MRITYRLDGKDIAPEDLDGKSGHVEIVLRYTNDQQGQYLVNGEERTLYTPYVAMSSMAFDNDVFSNVKVSAGGLVLDDGQRTTVTAVAFPGMNQNFDFGPDTELPEEIQV